MDFLDDLKTNFRSWEQDCNTVEDAEHLTELMLARHPKEDAKVVRQWCFQWVGVEDI